MKLVIVESPAKSKTIEKYLGEDYVVKASVGHVRDLPKSNKNAIDIKGGFVPRYEVAAGKEKVLNELRQLAGKADEVFLATDPDREGEAIAWHLAEALGLAAAKKRNVRPVHRVTFNEITKQAVLEAFSQPREIDNHLRQAQEARRVLDRLVGYDLSGIIWKKVRYGLSAGRVQSPALRILMEREREIRAFIPEDYWTLEATLSGAEGVCAFVCSEEPRSLEEALRIEREATSRPWHIGTIKESQQQRSPYPPFITSTLQQVASTRLGFSPSRTMALAQKLYEAGHISYMRTDSPTLSTQALHQLAHTIERTYGAEHVATKNFASKSKSAQEAHEAIRPSDPSKASAGSTDEQKKLYALIRSRAIASQMKNALLARTKVTATVSGAEIPDFAALGSRVLYEGWLKADPAARGDDVEVPAFTEGEQLTLAAFAKEGKQTTPPNRYTEAGLIKELEKRGIGRPSTYAAIMKNIIDRGYVEKTGKTLIPTDTGDVVSTFLEKHFDTYISDTFTAEMENELDDIARGVRKYEVVLKDFYEPFSKALKEKDAIEKQTNLGPVADDIRCPLCDGAMYYKLGRAGRFMSCNRYPECDGARTEHGGIVQPDVPLGLFPETSEPIFVLTGKYGPYVQVGDPKRAKADDTKKKKAKLEKPKRASLPKGKDPSSVTLEEALLYLSIPRTLGVHPDTGKPIVASVGRFGPYIVHDGDFRSLKKDDVYTITLARALEILAEPKSVGRRGKPPRGKRA